MYSLDNSHPGPIVGPSNCTACVESRMVKDKLASLLGFLRVVRTKLGPTRTTLGAVTITASVAGSASAQDVVQATPQRPPYYSRSDTIHRYGEKFILSQTDSVVIRADTVWYPRKSNELPRPLSSPTPTAPSPAYPSSGGGARGHQSHYSHSSHSSHRSGGWQ
jgi:hypothetical protein